MKLNKIIIPAKAGISHIVGMKYTLIILILILCFSCKEKKAKKSVSSLPYFNSADFTPEWDTPKHKIPKFSFIDQNGESITNKTYKDKIYIADFFFTSCPGICPKLTKNMAAIQEAYKVDKDIMLLSHTVMPWRDSVPLLKDYAKKHHVNSEKWHLVTGDKDALYNIARNGYFADEDFTKTQDESNFIHTENFVLVDKQGYIRGVYNGTLEIDVERLKRHIKILKQEI